MTVLTGLAKFRVEESRAPTIDTLPTGLPSTFAFTGRLLMVDQALQKAGWLLYDFRDGQCVEVARGMWKSPHGLAGHAAMLEAATVAFDCWRTLVGTWGPDQVVHETPPVGGRMVRPESSLVAASALRCAALLHDVPVAMQQAQQVKKRWTGKATTEKADVQRALNAWDPGLSSRRPWNQDVSDALALGLTWAEVHAGPLGLDGGEDGDQDA